MSKFNVVITETLERMLKVSEADAIKALETVQDKYHRGEIILDSNDYTGTSFSVEELTEEP